MITRYTILLFIAAVIGLVSCKNNDEVFKTVLNANVNVINASADTLNFYLNGTRQNNTSSLYPTSFSYYLPVPSGQQNYQFKKAGGFTDLFSVPLNLKVSTYNSLYITGGTSGQAFSTIDTLQKDSSLVLVRFVNASPDAGNLTVSIGDTVYFPARTFKTSSKFLPVGSGIKTVKIYQAGTTNLLIDTAITMLPNDSYTLFSKGLLKGKGNSMFDVGVVLNVSN